MAISEDSKALGAQHGKLALKWQRKNEKLAKALEQFELVDREVRRAKLDIVRCCEGCHKVTNMDDFRAYFFVEDGEVYYT